MTKRNKCIIIILTNHSLVTYDRSKLLRPINYRYTLGQSLRYYIFGIHNRTTYKTRGMIASCADRETATTPHLHRYPRK